MVKKVEENYRDDYFAESEGDLMPTLSFSDDDFEVHVREAVGLELARIMLLGLSITLVQGPLVELTSSAPSSAPSSPEILRHVDRCV
jgi:hypothetical protein